MSDLFDRTDQDAERPNAEHKKSLRRSWKSSGPVAKLTVVFAGLGAGATFLYVCIAAWQLVVMNRAAKASGEQTKNLIEAANIQASSAKQFAASAAGINRGVSEAVGKLNLQASAANRLAKNTEIANNNALQADRPWMGATLAVSDFDVGKIPIFTLYFTNTGKRPAKVDLMATRANFYFKFPADPDQEYVFDTTPSTSVVVPGQNVISFNPVKGELTQGEMNLFIAGTVTYFFFGKIEYRDLKTNQSYWTHVCYRYMPTTKTSGDNGFRNCTEYNDAR